MSGITSLRQSKYKYRHSGSKEVVQIPGQGYILKRNEKGQFMKKHTKKLRGWAKAKKNQAARPVPERVRQYTINKKQVRHRILNYMNQMKGEKLLYFWTITFPQSTSDDTAFILLNKWLTRLRTEKMLKEYLWITERQENKTIHFHMVINRRMNVVQANRYMRASIMHSINTGEVTYDRIKATRYKVGDIAKDRQTKRVINFAKQKRQKSLSNYLTKYVTKNNETFTHLAWHSSREYSNLIIAVRFTRKEMNNSNCKHLVDFQNPLIGEYYIHYRWKGRPPDDLLKYLAKINQSIQKLLNEPTDKNT